MIRVETTVRVGNENVLECLDSDAEGCGGRLKVWWRGSRFNGDGGSRPSA